MKIGIDIDDTVANTVDSMVYYGDKYDKEVLGRNGSNGNVGLIKDRYYLKTLYGWTDEEKFNFFRMYYKNILEECKPIKEAVEVINKFKNEGHKIFFATARLSDIENCDTYEITKKWLDENNFSYDYLKVSAQNKLEVCESENLDIFIDDSFTTCEEIKNSGIEAVLMTTLMNQGIDSKNVFRAKNWYETYNFINKMNLDSQE